MGKVVDHDERRREILHKSLHLFADLGYPQVTFQQIADGCGLSRTALYKYFQNKKEVFDEALYQLVKNIALEVEETVKRNTLCSASDKLELVVMKAIDVCLKNPALLQAIIEYLIAQKRQGLSVEKRIRRHTVAFRKTIRTLIYEGIQSGEFRKVSPLQSTDMLFGLMQAVAIRIMFYDDTDHDHLIQQCKTLIHALKN